MQLQCCQTDFLEHLGPDVYFNSTPPKPDVYLEKSVEENPLSNLTVPGSFGKAATVFILEGRLPKASPVREGDYPAVTFVDDKGRVALRVTIAEPIGEVVLSNDLHVSKDNKQWDMWRGIGKNVQKKVEARQMLQIPLWGFDKLCN